MPLTLHHRRTVTPVADFAEASRIYSDRRDASGLGASRFPDATIKDGERVVARVSYNGRVWAPGEWKPGDAPLYDTRS